MAITLEEYLNFYRGFVTGNYQIYPEDKDYLLTRHKLIHYDRSMEMSHQDYVDAFTAEEKTKFADYMLPDSFAGDVRNAKIFFITANPKLGGSDYDVYRQERFGTPEYLNECTKKVLMQDKDFLEKYPFWPIYSDFDFSGGYYWWYRRRNIMALIAKLNNDLWKVSLDDATNRFAKLFTNIELLPYRSVRFDINTAKQLRAYKINKAFIEDYLIPKALNGEIYIVFSWGANQFSVPESENIYILPSRHAQGLTFNPEAKEVEIGRRIFEFIEKNNL